MPRLACTTAVLASTLIGLAACGSHSSKSVTVKGTVYFSSSDFVNEVGTGLDVGKGDAGSICFGKGPYSDLGVGGQVVIADSAGKTVGVAPLTMGVFKNFGCYMPFTTTVPAGKGFYSVTDGHRGAVTETESKLSSVALTVGGLT